MEKNHIKKKKIILQYKGPSQQHIKEYSKMEKKLS